MTDLERAYVPAKTLNSPYPLIDSDPHIRRVFGYARPSDYVAAAGIGALSPGLMLFWEQVSPSYVGKGGFAPIMRLSGAVGVIAGVLMLSMSSCSMLIRFNGKFLSYGEADITLLERFYGFSENKREIDMDMREMVDKVKKGEPLYGKSTLSPYMQGVAARNSRYSGIFLYVMPWFNFVNHNQHGVDTAKYYQQAERELEAERNAKL